MFCQERCVVACLLRAVVSLIVLDVHRAMQNKITLQQDNISELEERITCLTDEMNKVKGNNDNDRIGFYNLLTAPKTVSNMYAQKARVQSCATYQALITCNMSWATWYKGRVQLLSLKAFKSHLF